MKHKHDNNTVLLFGGRGFIGGHICRALLKKGYRVLLHTTSTGSFENLKDVIPHPNVIVTGCAYDDFARIEQLIAQSDFFIHAAIPYFLQTLGADARRAVAAEVAKYHALLKLLSVATLKKAVFISACGTIGEPASGSFGLATEDDVVTNVAGWGHLEHKLKYEAMALDFCKKGVPVVVVNPALLVGEHDCKPSTGEFFVFLDSAFLNILGDKKINIVDVEDAADGVVLAMEKGRVGERYILASDNALLGDLTAKIKQLGNKKMPVVKVPLGLVIAFVLFFERINCLLKMKRPLVPLMGIENLGFGIQHYSHQKAARELGYAPKSAWPAVSRAYAWYKAKGIL